MSDIARYYDAAANPDGRVFHGVPLADLDASTWDNLPKWLQESVDASGLYRKTKPSGPAQAESRAVRPAPKKKAVRRKPAPAAQPAPVPTEQAAPVESES